MLVDDHFGGLEITDGDVDRIELVADLIRHIETWDDERRRWGAAAVFHNLFGPHVARVFTPAKQQESCGEAALIFLRLAGDPMHSLSGWCRETRQTVDLQLYVDDVTLSRIWPNVLHFQCPHCGTKHETEVQRLAAKPLSLEVPKTQHTMQSNSASADQGRRGSADHPEPSQRDQTGLLSEAVLSAAAQNRKFLLSYKRIGGVSPPATTN